MASEQKIGQELFGTELIGSSRNHHPFEDSKSKDKTNEEVRKFQ
jgi:hypothetical protein